MYADYEFYTTEYYGSMIPEADYNAAAERGSEYIDYITRNGASAEGLSESAQTAIKKCNCALAEAYTVINKAKSAAVSDNGELASQTVGAWSATYRSGAEIAKDSESSLYAIATRYLAATGLLYRGGKCSCICPTL